MESVSNAQHWRYRGIYNIRMCRRTTFSVSSINRFPQSCRSATRLSWGGAVCLEGAPPCRQNSVINHHCQVSSFLCAASNIPGVGAHLSWQQQLSLHQYLQAPRTCLWVNTFTNQTSPRSFDTIDTRWSAVKRTTVWLMTIRVCSLSIAPFGIKWQQKRRRGEEHPIQASSGTNACHGGPRTSMHNQERSSIRACADLHFTCPRPFVCRRTLQYIQKSSHSRFGR